MAYVVETPKMTAIEFETNLSNSEALIPVVLERLNRRQGRQVNGVSMRHIAEQLGFKPGQLRAVKSALWKLVNRDNKVVHYRWPLTGVDGTFDRPHTFRVV